MYVFHDSLCDVTTTATTIVAVCLPDSPQVVAPKMMQPRHDVKTLLSWALQTFIHGYCRFKSCIQGCNTF